MSKKYKLFVLFVLLSLALDQGTKIWARHELKPRFPGVITVVPGFFELRYSENTGSAFGLFRGLPGARYVLFLVGVAALVIVAGYLRRADPDKPRIAAELGLLAGGALGNIIDRVAFGRVTDFVVWRVGTHEWPTFNVADAALVVGVLAVLLDMRGPDTARPPPGSVPPSRARGPGS
jgi:signal peptidase II